MFDFISAGGVIPLARLLKDFFSVDLVHMRAESSRKVAYLALAGRLTMSILLL